MLFLPTLSIAQYETLTTVDQAKQAIDAKIDWETCVDNLKEKDKLIDTLQTAIFVMREFSTQQDKEIKAERAVTDEQKGIIKGLRSNLAYVKDQIFIWKATAVAMAIAAGWAIIDNGRHKQ